DRPGAGSRVQLRMLDLAANPCAAVAVQRAAGLEGNEREAAWREPVNTNTWEMSYRERRGLRIDDLPQNLTEACDELEKDRTMQEALGEEVTQHFLAAKREEWREYITQVTQWEVQK